LALHTTLGDSTLLIFIHHNSSALQYDCIHTQHKAIGAAAAWAVKVATLLELFFWFVGIQTLSFQHYITRTFCSRQCDNFVWW